MEDGDSWRNKGKVEVISAADAALGIFFVLFYSYYGIVFFAGSYPMPGEEVSVHLGRFLTLMLGLIVFSVNGSQIYISLKLLRALKFVEEPSAQECKARSRTWFKMSTFLIILLIVKFFFLCLVPLGPNNNFDFFLCLFEFIFRIFGMFFVKEFLDDISTFVVAAASSAVISRRQKEQRSSSLISEYSSASISPSPYPADSTVVAIPMVELQSNAKKSSKYMNAIGGSETRPAETDRAASASPRPKPSRTSCAANVVDPESPAEA